jgi:quercetin dioxygenase-like cupin family protein
MSIADLHTTEKAVSALSIFKGSKNNTTAIQIVAEQELKEHISKLPGLLLCVMGDVTYHNEKWNNNTLISGDYLAIVPNVKHWLISTQTSNLLLIK